MMSGDVWEPPLTTGGRREVTVFLQIVLRSTRHSNQIKFTKSLSKVTQGSIVIMLIFISLFKDISGKQLFYIAQIRNLHSN